MNTSQSLITILGPTASGKTELAAHVAAQMDAEIISADSRQVYRQMDIGTGKDLQDYVVGGVEIPHHLIDCVDAGYKYNVYEYQRDFLQVYQALQKAGKPAILCGGSGMYIEAVLNGYQMTSVPVDGQLRSCLEQLTDSQLAEMLAAIKPLHNKSDLDTRKRTIRAIEIAKYQATASVPENPKIESVIFGISMERAAICKRIYDRLKQRLRDGMIDEVQKLLDSGVPAVDLMYYGLEYKYVTQYLMGEFSYNRMVEQLNIAIRQFAKRQMTWFRRMERNGFTINWIDGTLPLEQKVAAVVGAVSR